MPTEAGRLELLEVAAGATAVRLAEEQLAGPAAAVPAVALEGLVGQVPGGWESVALALTVHLRVLASVKVSPSGRC